MGIKKYIKTILGNFYIKYTFKGFIEKVILLACFSTNKK